MDTFFSLLSFFTSGLGLLTISIVAALVILIWDWRFSLVLLFVIQIGVATLLVSFHSIEPQWAMVQTLVIALCCLILALSASEARSNQRLHSTSPWFLRFMAMVLVIVGWNLVDIQITLPAVNPQIAQLFIWIGICALIVLGLSDTPLFTGIAILLWLIPIQAVLEVILPIPMLIVFLGLIELLVALSCSYLVLAHRQPTRQNTEIATDMTFPKVVSNYRPDADPITSSSIPALPAPVLPTQVVPTSAYGLTRNPTQEHYHVQYPEQKTAEQKATEQKMAERKTAEQRIVAQQIAAKKTAEQQVVERNRQEAIRRHLTAEHPVTESYIEAFDPEPTLDETSTKYKRPTTHEQPTGSDHPVIPPPKAPRSKPRPQNQPPDPAPDRRPNRTGRPL